MSTATVVVPTVHAGHRLERLLRSLASQTVEPEVLIVDNGSAANGARRVTHELPGARVVRLEENAGFSRAVNLGASQSSGEVLVLVNDDCVCEPAFVESLVRAIDGASDAVMAAGVLRDREDQTLIDTAGMELDPTLLVFDYLNGEPMSRLDGDPAPPIGPSAAAAAFDRGAFLEIGGFDERLFAYWEDVDLVLRMRRAGGRCVLAAGARGTHEHSATLGSGSPEKNYLMGYGRGYVLRKWGVVNARRLPSVVARDGVICLGQALVDRNAAGIRGRARGWRSATPEGGGYPAGVASANARTTALGTLERRARRRLRLARRRRAA